MFDHKISNIHCIKILRSTYPKYYVFKHKKISPEEAVTCIFILKKFNVLQILPLIQYVEYVRFLKCQRKSKIKQLHYIIYFRNIIHVTCLYDICCVLTQIRFLHLFVKDVVIYISKILFPLKRKQRNFYVSVV